jgi:hypothetical protein
MDRNLHQPTKANIVADKRRKKGLSPAPSATTTPGLRVQGKGHICPLRSCLQLLALRSQSSLARKLAPVAPARLGTPVIVLAARCASVRAAPVSSFANPSLSLPHVPPPLRAALPPRTRRLAQRDCSVSRSIRSAAPHSHASRCSFVAVRERIRRGHPLPHICPPPAGGRPLI